MTTETPAIVDALPYIDLAIDTDDAQRELAMKLVDDEMMVYPPERDYLDYLADADSRPFLTPCMQEELQALEQAAPRSARRDVASMEVVVPLRANSDMSEEEIKLWTESLEQIKIKLEYRQRQLGNLELLKTYGVPAWEQHTADTERMELDMKREIEQLGVQIQELNAQRKSHQQQISKQLDILQTHWDNLSVGNRLLADEIASIRAKLQAAKVAARR